MPVFWLDFLFAIYGMIRTEHNNADKFVRAGINKGHSRNLKLSKTITRVERINFCLINRLYIALQFNSKDNSKYMINDIYLLFPT